MARGWAVVWMHCVSASRQLMHQREWSRCCPGFLLPAARWGGPWRKAKEFHQRQVGEAASLWAIYFEENGERRTVPGLFAYVSLQFACDPNGLIQWAFIAFLLFLIPYQRGYALRRLNEGAFLVVVIWKDGQTWGCIMGRYGYIKVCYFW